MKSRLVIFLSAILMLSTLVFAGDNHKATLKVKGLKCQNCADRVETTLKSLKGVSNVKVDVKTGMAVVEYADLKVADLEKAVVASGFAVNQNPAAKSCDGDVRGKASAQCQAACSAKNKAAIEGKKLHKGSCDSKKSEGTEL